MAAVAQRVGVSISTLRSWEARYGLAPHARTRGGHRRYTAEDVARLQRLHQLIGSGMPTAAAAATVQAPPRRAPRRAITADHRAVGERLRLAVDALDGGSAERLAAQCIAEHGVVPAWMEVFTPVLQGVGQAWEANGAGIECEHLASEVIHSALTGHLRRIRPRRRESAQQVLLAATPDEAHTLPLYALAAALAEHGITGQVFGTLPAVALRAAIDRVRPPCVVLFARSRDTADQRLLRRITSTAPLICAGGIGWPARLPPKVAGARDLITATDLLRSTGSRDRGR